MIEPGLVATGLTGAWVNTVQGLIFLISIIFYLYVEEPQRRERLDGALRAQPEFRPDAPGRVNAAASPEWRERRITKGRERP